LVGPRGYLSLIFRAGAFPPVRDPAISGYIHGLSGLLVIFGSPIVFTLIGADLGGEEKRATIIVWIGLLLFVASLAVSLSRPVHRPLFW
jgi:hypothetical protein